MTDAIAIFWEKYKNNIKEFIESSASGFIGTGIHLLVSFVLDFYIDVNLSTIIGNIIGGIVDFILNTFIFDVPMSLEIMGKFIVQSICGMIGVLIFFNLIIHFIKKNRFILIHLLEYLLAVLLLF